MKVPVYRSKGELTTKSGSIFNPGVSVPYQLAAGPAQAADSASSWLGELSTWALKKQDLADQTEATKAKAYYEKELQNLRNRILYPRDEKDETLGINLYQLDTKTRELYWATGKKMLRGTVARDYGSKIGGKTARSALGVELDTVDMAEDNKFSTVINKRVLQQAAAATFVREDDRLERLSDKSLSLARRKQIQAEQEQDWRRQVAGGLQTAAQIDARRDKFRIAALANVIDRVSQDYADEQGVIKRSWLSSLRDDPTKALAGSENAYDAWMLASAEERRELLEDMHKTRKRQLDIAVAEAKTQDAQDENKVEVLFNRLYDADNTDERKKIFGEIEHFMRNNPGVSDITALNKARKFAYTGESDRFGDDAQYLNLTDQMYDVVENEDGVLVPSVTRQRIMEARLTTEQTRNLLLALKTAKDTRAAYGRQQIKAAAGLVADVESALSDNANTAITTVVANVGLEFNQWFQRNRGTKNQGEILAKADEFADKVRGQVGALYIAEYEDRVRSVSLALDFKEMLKHPSVNGNITKMFDDGARDVVIKDLMNNKPDTLQMKLDATWRRSVILKIELLKTLARQANVQVR